MDIFKKINNLLQKGIVIDCVTVNQVNNGNKEKVNAGDIPLITYTVGVMDLSLDEVYYQESCNTFKEAIEAGIRYAETYLI